MRTSIKTFAVAALTVGALVAAPAAFAEETTVTQAVTTGGLTTLVTGGVLAGVTASHTDKTSAASFSLTADDLTGTAAGWNVTQQITELAYSGDNTGTAIGAADFFVAPGAITANGGASDTGVAAGPGGTLDTAKKVLAAEVGSGVGNYTQTIAATLTVPADSRAGTYTGTLTTTMTTAP